MQAALKPVTRSANSEMIPAQTLSTRLRILPCGDAALTVEFGQVIDAAINAQVIGFDQTIQAAKLEGIIETVPTYRSLTVHYDPLSLSFSTLSDHLLKLYELSKAAGETGRLWHVPVIYGGEFGLDLEFLAQTKSMTMDEIIARHSAPTYRVFMIGFTPGFAYLGGLDPLLATPRRQTPRLSVPPGCIAIGGEQAAIQCLSSPLGWHVLGRTPVRTFHPTRKQMFLLEPGDSVRFYPVSHSEWASLDRAAEAGELVAELVQS